MDSGDDVLALCTRERRAISGILTAPDRACPGQPKASLSEVRSDLADIGRRLTLWYRSDVPDFPGFATNVVPLLDSVAGKNLQAALWLLLGAVSLVLLVACANVGNLLLARGAAAPEVLRMVVADGMRLPLIGMIIGIAAALALTRLMTRLLYGTSPTDPLTYAAVALTLGAVALCACYAPARRAAAIQPIDALRHE